MLLRAVAPRHIRYLQAGGAGAKFTAGNRSSERILLEKKMGRVGTGGHGR
jgi:hypothetical protein